MASKRVGCRIVFNESDIPETHTRLSLLSRRLSRKYRLPSLAVKHEIQEARADGRARDLDAVKLVHGTAVTNEQGFRVAPVFLHSANTEAAIRRLAEARTAAAAVVKQVESSDAVTAATEPARVSAIVDPLVVELQALRASVAELTRGMADLRAAVELRTEAELCGTRCVDND